MTTRVEPDRPADAGPGSAELDVGGPPLAESLGDDEATALYLREISRAPLLAADEEVALARRREAGTRAAERLAAGVDDPAERDRLQAIRSDGDAAERRLIESNLRLVVSIARKHARRGLPLLDLIQEGNIGLQRAVAGYDWRLGYRFSTYAFWWIRQAIDRALAEQGRLIRLPVHVIEELGRLRSATRELALELGREPTTEEIGSRLDVEARRVRAILQAAMAPTSIDAPIGGDGDLRVADVIVDGDEPQPAEQAERNVLAEDLDNALRRHLSPREVAVIESRFGLRGRRPRTFVEIGEELGVSRQRARQLETAAIRKLRHATPVLRLLHDFAS